jgi:hypothetical protein
MVFKKTVDQQRWIKHWVNLTILTEVFETAFFEGSSRRPVQIIVRQDLLEGQSRWCSNVAQGYESDRIATTDASRSHLMSIGTLRT